MQVRMGIVQVDGSVVGMDGVHQIMGNVVSAVVPVLRVTNARRSTVFWSVVPAENALPIHPQNPKLGVRFKHLSDLQQRQLHKASLLPSCRRLHHFLNAATLVSPITTPLSHRRLLSSMIVVVLPLRARELAQAPHKNRGLGLLVRLRLLSHLLRLRM